jgi:hypothetical protein
MEVIIGNGQAVHDTKLTFEFSSTQGPINLWVVKLPLLKNPDAFPEQVAPRRWKLFLRAVADTQPLEIRKYTPASARQWLAKNRRKYTPAPSELLIVCQQGQFTTSIHQNSR